MKVQDVRKECTAVVGLSLEFSNSEVGCISHLLWEVNNAIERAVDQKIKMMQQFEQGCHPLDYKDNVPVAIDLKALMKIKWLLYQMTRTDRCDLFNEANREYETEINSINNQCLPSKPSNV